MSTGFSKGILAGNDLKQPMTDDTRFLDAVPSVMSSSSDMEAGIATSAWNATEFSDTT